MELKLICLPLVLFYLLCTLVRHHSKVLNLLTEFITLLKKIIGKYFGMLTLKENLKDFLATSLKISFKKWSVPTLSKDILLSKSLSILGSSTNFLLMRKL